jgi:hypothetical protein
MGVHYWLRFLMFLTVIMIMVLLYLLDINIRRFNEEKVGLKVGDNKNLLVKDYQDLMLKKSFLINNEDTIHEITTFVKHTTSAGNVRYAADVGHDDNKNYKWV